MTKSRIREAVVLEFFELDKLNNEFEIEKRTDYLQKILSDVYDYENYLNEYNFNLAIKSLCHRGMKFKLIENVENIKKTWDDIFTSEISSERKRKIYYEDYKWHVFSFNILNSEEKSNVNTSFLKCKKTNVYIFFQHSNQCYKIDNFHLLEENDILDYKIHDYISDFYIFDITEKWTYIYTHEENCGPYFYQIK